MVDDDPHPFDLCPWQLARAGHQVLWELGGDVPDPAYHRFTGESPWSLGVLALLADPDEVGRCISRLGQVHE